MNSPASGRIRPVGKFFFEGEQKFFLKGVTYGPFKPDAEGHYLGRPEQVARDLAQMREVGLNVMRIYHTPPIWFLDQCAAARMRVLVTLPWEKHVEFLRKKSARAAIADAIKLAVSKNAGHPAVLGYLVGNEISPTMVRWLGVRRVAEFIEYLIRLGRSIDSDILFSYASYPPTEYLLPQNADFFCFNVYLHEQREFERYLLRLQNLAEERPLILGEFGLDTIRHSEEEQAQMLGWHVDSVVKCGLAGTIFFSWTDEWFTGEEEITDWAFGIVTRAREPKKSFFTLREKLGQDDAALPHRPLPRTPSVSVIVCSYNGAKTMAASLHSPKQPRIESRAQYRRRRCEGRGICLHRFRLHGRSRLALLPHRYFAQWRLCWRRRSERFAAGAKLDPGLRRGCARWSKPRTPHRHDRRAHSWL